MFKKFGFVVAVFMALVVAVPSAQAVTVAEIVERMDEIIKEMQSLQTEFSGLAGQVGNSSSGQGTGSVLGAQTSKRLTQTIAYGETNDDIALIQRLLATDPEIYPYGVSSGFFGPKTQEAIRNLQTRFNLDPVGVVGPATTALLEAFFAKHSTEPFASDALATDPRVAGASTSNNQSIADIQAAIEALQSGGTTAVSTGSVKSIVAELDRGEADVTIYYVNGNKKEFIVYADDEDSVIEAIARRSALSEAVVRAALSVDEDDDDDSDYDEDDAEDAIDDADEAIEDAEDEIEEADDDGDDVDWAEDTLDEAKDLLEEAEEAYDDEDWDEAVELAEEAKELAEEAEDRIDEEEDSKGKKGDSDDIDEITAEIDDGETDITVEYENGDEYEFTVDEDKEDEIIEEVADELDMDEDDVEDLIEFDYGDVDEINVLVDGDEAEVEVEYESGVIRRFTIDADDEDDMIEEIADEIDEDEDDVEEWTDFDYS